MWIDRVVALEPGERMVAVKHVSLAEDHLHDHFPAEPARGLPAQPLMPGSLIIEGMAQTAGVLVGHSVGFREKVVLAKVGKAELRRDATPGCTLRYTAAIDRTDETGASTTGEIELIEPGPPGAEPPAALIGAVDLIFAFADRNRSGLELPEENFVFGEGFRTLLRLSGIEIPEDPGEPASGFRTPGAT